MPKQTLELDTLGDIDSGALRIAVNDALKTIMQDLQNRPALDKARKIGLFLEFKPVQDTNSNHGNLDHADTAWHVDVKVPSIASSGIVMKPDKDGHLFFHSDLPEDPDDETLMDEADRVRHERGGNK